LKIIPNIIDNWLSSEALAKVSNVHPPQPLPSREGLIYQPSPLVGEGGGEGVMDFCKSLIINKRLTDNESWKK